MNPNHKATNECNIYERRAKKGKVIVIAIPIRICYKMHLKNLSLIVIPIFIKKTECK